MPSRDFIRRESKMPKNTSNNDLSNHFETENDFFRQRASMKQRSTIASKDATNPESLTFNSQTNK
jgi:hypothetical protein